MYANDDSFNTQHPDHVQEPRRTITAPNTAVSTYILGAIRAGLSVLADRSLLLLALASSITLFAFTLANPSTLRLITACLFTTLVFLPVLFLARKP